MKVRDIHRRTIWLENDQTSVTIIDQTKLPHYLETRSLKNLGDATEAIIQMRVRGAPLIGATAAWGMYLAARDNPSDKGLESAFDELTETRPTAINLRWALEKASKKLLKLPEKERALAARVLAEKICNEDVHTCRLIGEHGVSLIRDIWESKGKLEPVHIMTHCNAGWLATVDWGTATAPIYLAQEQDIPVHVWVDETRPRNQGASLTAWELSQQGIPYTLISDNAGGHLMQSGQVDLLITGTDRTTANGDVANKIGTYLKALSAKDNNIPFYVALPSSTIDWNCQNGSEIPIEQRDQEEVLVVTGMTAAGKIESVNIAPSAAAAANPAFDITPARLVTGLITERGICRASKDALENLFPEHQQG